MQPWLWHFEDRIDASPWIVIENYFDEEHLTALHSRHVASSRILERSGRAALHEIRTRILGIPVAHLEWIQFNPPGELVFRSRALLGSMEVRAVLHIEADGAGSRIRTDYTIMPAWFWRPFKSLLLDRMKAWKMPVWEEDKPLLLRREKLFRAGFRGGALKTMVSLPPAPEPPPAPPAPGGWLPFCTLQEVREKGRIVRWMDARREVCALWHGGKLQVFDAVCPHAGGPLGECGVREGVPVLRCSWHGYVFRLDDGVGSQGLSLGSFPHKVEDGVVFVRF